MEPGAVGEETAPVKGWDAQLALVVPCELLAVDGVVVAA
jgi:hypothetical protein